MQSSYLDIVSDANNLFDAFSLARKGSGWKSSTQKCQADLLLNILHLSDSLKDGTYRQRPFCEFILSERGKIRPIRSQHILDRIVQRSLCDNVLIPKLSPYLIYDNGASLKNKGIDFARNRLITHLEKFLRRHDKGFALCVDFSKFFDNIPHDKLLDAINSHLGADRSIEALIKHLVDVFKADVSYMSDEEYATVDQRPFSTLKHRERLITYNKTHKGKREERSLAKSVGIGSQISQISGVFYPCLIDNFFKCKCGFKYYGRYMDDVYIIHHVKQELLEAIENFDTQARRLGLFINRKKTHITDLSTGFEYLKIHYAVRGKKITKKPDNVFFQRERRRLKSLRSLLDKGRVTREQIRDAYLSWRGNAALFKSCRRNLKYTDKLYTQLFVYN